MPYRQKNITDQMNLLQNSKTPKLPLCVTSLFSSVFVFIHCCARVSMTVPVQEGVIHLRHAPPAATGAFSRYRCCIIHGVY
ncbi:hypothetical protein F2P79_000172 [Pimephales promelas]|nr:hypothetical protein F2P79_000172 [Pimephales promelas]